MELIDLVNVLSSVPSNLRQQKINELRALATASNNTDMLSVLDLYDTTPALDLEQMYTDAAANGTANGTAGNKSSGGTNWGAIASAAGGAITDIANMVGKILGNEAKEKASSYTAGINALLNSSMTNATSYDDLAKQWSNSATITTPDKNGFGYVGTGKAITGALSAGAKGAATGAQIGGPIGAAIGAVAAAGVNVVGTLFGNKNAKKQAELVKQKAQQANNFKIAGFQNNAYNIGNNRMSNMQANWIALGGPLLGAVEYNFMLQSLLNEQQRMNNYTNKITSMPNSFSNEFSLGGIRNGGYFSNGLTYVGEGGTHELNPYEGVLIGYDLQGTPNLVEEGEYIWNDYVFSNRLKVPKEAKNVFGLGGKKDGYTFAEAVDFLQKESEERPNDAISSNYLEKQLLKLLNLQEEVRILQNNELLVNKFSGGGKIMDGKKESLWFMDTHATPYYNAPGDTLERKLYAYKQGMKDGTLTKDELAIYNMLLEDEGIAPYLLGHKDLSDITDEFALLYYGKFTDKNYKKGRWHDFIASSPTVNTPYVQTTVDVPIKLVSIDDKGNVSSSNILLDGADLIYKGTKRGFLKWLNTKDKETGVSPALRLNSMGYNTSSLKLEKSGNDYYLNLDLPTNSGTKKETKKEPKKVTTTYKAKVGNNYIDVKGNELFENPAYTNYKKANTYTDLDGNVTYYWDPVQDEVSKSGVSYLRFAPIVGNLGSVLTDSIGITNKPDYTEADAILNSTQGLQYPTFTPLGNKIKLDPIDINYYGNLMASLSAAARNQILNQSGLNRGTATAGLLAADYNALNAYGDLLLKTALENNKLKVQESTFNRETDLFNSLYGLQAAMARTQVDLLKQQGIIEAMKQHLTERQLMDTNKSTNVSGLFNSLGELGREQYAMDMINNNKALLYSHMGELKDDLVKKANKNGGYLTIKKKRK